MIRPCTSPERCLKQAGCVSLKPGVRRTDQQQHLSGPSISVARWKPLRSVPDKSHDHMHDGSNRSLAHRRGFCNALANRCSPGGPRTMPVTNHQQQIQDQRPSQRSCGCPYPPPDSIDWLGLSQKDGILLASLFSAGVRANGVL